MAPSQERHRDLASRRFGAGDAPSQTRPHQLFSLPPPPLQSLSPGCKLWGAIIEVMPRELVVSLPHGLRGHVAYGETSGGEGGRQCFS